MGVTGITAPSLEHQRQTFQSIRTLNRNKNIFSTSHQKMTSHALYYVRYSYNLQPTSPSLFKYHTDTTRTSTWTTD